MKHDPLLLVVGVVDFVALFVAAVAVVVVVVVDSLAAASASADAGRRHVAGGLPLAAADRFSRSSRARRA